MARKKKTIPLDQVIDEQVGKVGTPERTEFDNAIEDRLKFFEDTVTPIEGQEGAFKITTEDGGSFEAFSEFSEKPAKLTIDVNRLDTLFPNMKNYPVLDKSLLMEVIENTYIMFKKHNGVPTNYTDIQKFANLAAENFIESLK